MKEKTIEFENQTLDFKIEKDTWKLSLAKSETRLKSMEQMRIMTETSDAFVPVEIEEDADTFYFDLYIDPENKKWKDIEKLAHNEKLRLLCNTAELKNYLTTRLTFFLHPDNLVFDDNLMPAVIYRGIRELVPPYEMDEQSFHKQLQCFAIALFSKTFSYDQLYNGALRNAKGTEFERQVSETKNLDELIVFLRDSYKKEQKKTEKEMQVVPAKRFRMFKQLSIIMIAASVLLAIPMIYIGFVKLPFQDKLLAAHGDFLASDYNSVIETLGEEDPEKLPNDSKYILASSYISVENLSDKEKEVIMKNVSLKSNEDYLLYWIYNGRGDFDKSVDKAKYIDDPTLVMYGIIKRIEQAKNNPDLTGTERDEQLEELTAELEKYREEYNVEADEENAPLTEEAEQTEVGSKETKKDDKSNEKKDNNQDEDKKDNKKDDN